MTQPPTPPTSPEPATAQFAFKPPVPHVRVLGQTMEPDPEHAGQMRQTAFCSTCAHETRTLDGRWPCEFVRAVVAARAEALAELRAKVREMHDFRVTVGRGYVDQCAFQGCPHGVHVSRAAVLALLADPPK